MKYKRSVRVDSRDDFSLKKRVNEGSFFPQHIKRDKAFRSTIILIAPSFLIHMKTCKEGGEDNRERREEEEELVSIRGKNKSSLSRFDNGDCERLRE